MKGCIGGPLVGRGMVTTPAAVANVGIVLVSSDNNIFVMPKIHNIVWGGQDELGERDYTGLGNCAAG